MNGSREANSLIKVRVKRDAAGASSSSTSLKGKGTFLGDIRCIFKLIRAEYKQKRAEYKQIRAD